MEAADTQRVSVSLAQLRAELTSMELRLVDRLNGALANKADRQIQEQLSARMSDYGSRLTLLENSALKADGPVAQQVAANSKQLNSLAVVSTYRRWLWAQTVALAAIAVAILGVWISTGAHA